MFVRFLSDPTKLLCNVYTVLSGGARPHNCNSQIGRLRQTGVIQVCVVLYYYILSYNHIIIK